MKKFKLIKQHDAKDCGVACLAMILNQYQTTIPISKLRVMSKTDNQGTTAYGMVAAMEQLGFECEVFKSDASLWQENLSFPLIAHVVVDGSFLHYVVIYGIKNGKILIADPAKGKTSKLAEEFNKEWTGIVLTATPTEQYKPVKDELKGLLSFIPLLLPQKKIIFEITLLSFLLTGFGIIGSYYFQLIIDRIVPARSANLLEIISIGLLTMYMIQAFLQYLKRYLLILLGQRLSTSIMLRYFDHVLHLPMSFFSTRKSGEIISRFLDATKIIDALANATLSLFLDASMVISVGLVLYLQNAQLFFISLATIPIYALIVFSFIKRFDQTNEEQMEAGATVNSQIIESLKGIETIRSFNATDHISNKVTEQFNEMMEKTFKNLNLDNIQANLKNALQVMSSTVLLWFGTTLVLKGQMTIGQLITYNALMIFFTTPLQNIINLQVKIQTAKVANDRLNEVLFLEQERLAKSDLLDTPIRSTDSPLIEFKNVSFSYGFSENVLTSLSCVIPENSKTAIVGMSGSGKSTLVKLLMNFYTPEEGEIFYQGQDLRSISRLELRHSFSYVPQDPFFFSGTIMENLLFGIETKPSLKEIEQACELAQIKSYIDQLPLTYQTSIEEGATNLSGGQKQRLAIARALLKQSNVMILDEATSGLDTRLEHLIIDNLMAIQNKTIIFIAHHLPIAKKCDVILVLEDGQLVESGSHQHLLDLNGTYKTLWEMMTVA